MRPHAPISPRKRRANSGQKLRFKGEYPAHLHELSPGMWDLDGDGRPVWIARLPGANNAPWFPVVVPPAAGVGPPRRGAELSFIEAFSPGAMPWVPELAPRLWRERPQTRRPGGPRLEDAATRVSAATAWAGDMRDVSTWELARQLSPWANPYAARRYAKPRLDAGRHILHQLGVLPWLLWEDGRLPAGWWADGRFAGALRGWYHVHALSATVARREAHHPQ